MDRRGFLRFLGLGAAAVVAPTKAYSFLGNILRPRKELILPSIEASSDMVNWVAVSGFSEFEVTPLQFTVRPLHGILDRQLILDRETWIDLGKCAQPQARYLRLAAGSPNAVLVPRTT